MTIGHLIIRAGRSLITRFFDRAKTGTIPMPAGRADTLALLLGSLIRYVVDFVTGVSVLQLFDAPITSLLAGAGVVGLAIGFGAQNLVRDTITGFFLIFEDQFAVGDYITTAGVSGTVEELGLRITKLRDFSGELHIIPNGAIEKVTNHSRGNMRALVKVEVAYEESHEHVMRVLTGVCETLAAARPQDIMEGPTVLGISEFAASGVVYLLIARTVPMQQWSVERDLRRSIKEAFEREGIEIPYPKRVLIPRETGGREQKSSD